MSWRERLSFYLIIIVTFLFIIIVAFTVNLKNTGDMTDGEFVIGLGTLALAFGTIILALNETNEGRINRNLDRELADKDRRRLRLKEQLEGLYSPLMSCINFLDNRDAHRVEPLLSLMPNLRGKFEFLAENDLKELLRVYYETDIPVINKTEWDNLIDPMMDEIGTGCVTISLEYDDLTRKVT